MTLPSALMLRSPFARKLLFVVLTVGLTALIASGVHEAAGCTSNFKVRITCTHVPDGVGPWTMSAILYGGVFSVYVSPVLLVLAACAEIFVRRENAGRTKE